MNASMLLLFVPLAIVSGCSSLSSTYVGDASLSARFEGMPIVVQRPKYLKVTVKKVTYRVFVNSTEQRPSGTLASTAQTGPDEVVDEVSTEVLSVGEVYALDLKRPASGTTEYAVEFAPNAQYPSKVGAKIDDQTLAATGDLLKKAADAVFKPASTGAGENKSASVVRVSERIVKIELRSLADPAAKPIQIFP